MGISIKNEEIETAIRDYARRNKLGISEAVRQAIERADQLDQWDARKAERERSWAFNVNTAENCIRSTDGPWTREELYDR